MQRRGKTSTKRVHFDPNLQSNGNNRRITNESRDDNSEDNKAGHEALIFVYGHNVNLYRDVFHTSESATMDDIEGSYFELLGQLKFAYGSFIRQNLYNALDQSQLAKSCGMTTSQLAAGIHPQTFIEIKIDAINRAYEILANPKSRCEYDGYLKEFVHESANNNFHHMEHYDNRHPKKGGVDKRRVSVPRKSQTKDLISIQEENFWSEKPDFFNVAPSQIVSPMQPDPNLSPANSDAFDPFNILDDGVMESPQMSRKQSSVQPDMLQYDSFDLSPGTPDSSCIDNLHGRNESAAMIHDNAMFICQIPSTSKGDFGGEDTETRITENEDLFAHAASNEQELPADVDDLDEVTHISSKDYENIDEYTDIFDNIQESMSDTAKVGFDGAPEKAREGDDKTYNDDDECDIQQSLSDTAIIDAVGDPEGHYEPSLDCLDCFPKAITTKSQRKSSKREPQASSSSETNITTSGEHELEDSRNTEESTEIEFFECPTREFSDWSVRDDMSYVSFSSENYIYEHDDDDNTIFTNDTMPTAPLFPCTNIMTCGCIEEVAGALEDTAIEFRETWSPSIVEVRNKSEAVML